MTNECACSGCCRGTIGTYQPANVLHGSFMSPKDDIRGLCTVGVNMLHGGHPVCSKLLQRYRAANADPAIRVCISDLMQSHLASVCHAKSCSAASLH